ncbi:MAG: hypothetical protein EA378_03745 [Phycisphaerales bacterium]|nr:MAG: hypothetical protein EA378_03745 [Phycisphaerales bacterium]
MNRDPHRPHVPRYARDGAGASLGVEWLLTNGLGGFAAGTALGVNTRRYHGLLVAATRPPVGRVMALNAIADRVVPASVALGTGVDGPGAMSLFHFEGAERVRAHSGLERFEREVGCAWFYRLTVGRERVRVVKRLALVRERNAAVLRYEIERGGDAHGDLRLELRPLVSLRDFHGLVRLGDGFTATADHGEPLPGHEGTPAEIRGFNAEAIESGVVVRAGEHAVWVRAGEGGRVSRVAFDPSPIAWRGLHYEREAARGLDATEDLFSPGVLACALPAGVRTLAVEVTLATDGDHVPTYHKVEDAERARLEALMATAARARPPSGAQRADRQRTASLDRLVCASDAYVVRRRSIGGAGADDREPGTSVIAGYPWFSDWGRDTMIALPGLLLATGRLGEAGRVLETFAAFRRDGIIPNHFDDQTDEPMYNTVDAPLWFVVACCAYRESHGAGEAGDSLFERTLAPACLDVLRAYERGTTIPGRHSAGARIAMDPEDALIAAGDERTQLTWMDAQRDGVTFTPRHGKPVEIQALWHQALRALAGAIEATDPGEASRLRTLAARAGESLRAKFWSDRLGCLADALTPDDRGVWRTSGDVRPNQVFAVSLEHSALTPEQQLGVVRTVRERLWTPRGVRTLAPGSPGYRPRFRGPLFELDGAYHNGTAWPWLAGPLAEAWWRAHGRDASARAEARAMLEPLVEQLDADCPGAIAEVFDAEGDAREPQRAGGCFAQAWSVAEVLRVWGVVGG